jgi:hypothetical protein
MPLFVIFALGSLALKMAHVPEYSPWPPEEGSLSWCCYERLGQPVERMASMDMYLAVAEKVWAEIGDLDEVQSSLGG